MGKALFEMGAKFGDEWNSDNKQPSEKETAEQIKEPAKHQLHFAKEKRNGKTVTIVKPFYLKKADLQSLLKILKKKLGTGGTAKEASLEFQGDIAEVLRNHLETMEYKFKK
ncbi:MAG: translation initiation factor 1 [Campylobacterota bacterium]|nr:translation initiation factor 1 [Campylobacterota bacterium]